MIRRPVKKYFPKKGDCPFCKDKMSPDYKNLETIKKYISDRGKIVSRGRSGICSRHQRSLSKEIKRARHLAFLPF